MKKEIKGFSKYWLEDGKVISKRTGKEITVNNEGCVQLCDDVTKKWTTVGLRKIIRLADDNYKTYKQIEQERNVKYKPVFGFNNYLFCEEVEDDLKLWSIKNEYYLSPYYIDQHLRYTLNQHTKFFYTIVWEYYNQNFLPPNHLIHHQDEHPDNNQISNLIPMTRSEHTIYHNSTNPK